MEEFCRENQDWFDEHVAIEGHDEIEVLADDDEVTYLSNTTIYKDEHSTVISCGAIRGCSTPSFNHCPPWASTCALMEFENDGI